LGVITQNLRPKKWEWVITGGLSIDRAMDMLDIPQPSAIGSSFRSFNPKSFLAKIGEGRSIGKYRKEQIVFSQGDPADAVFYIQKGKVKITVVSEQGKEAVVAILGANEFFGEGCLAGQVQRIAFQN
jgi:CRP-like cAMP-binding protein